MNTICTINKVKIGSTSANITTIFELRINGKRENWIVRNFLDYTYLIKYPQAIQMSSFFVKNSLHLNVALKLLPFFIFVSLIQYISHSHVRIFDVCKYLCQFCKKSYA